MKMLELLKFDIPLEIIELWRKEESDVLLPIQEVAIKRHSLFEKGNLLVQAPTSSGKTFIGELAAIQTALRRRKVVYLVPLKALAEEKYLDFKEKYSKYGLKTIVSTRDHREFDEDFEHGSFSIAVAVYEKLSQLLVRRPERLEEIELVVADELELLSDPERGGPLELLLTRILQSSCRLIGLSAVIGEADRLAEWMDAGLVYYERRPIELRYGVIYEGKFKYRTYNEFGEGIESMPSLHAESPWEILTDNVCAMTERGESCLVFVKARHESQRGAELLAGRIQATAATQAVAALRELEQTRSRDTLLETLQAGVAFHNADLSPAERRIVEQAFRNGEAKVLVSTSTLAQGMNLPAQNVFISADKWRYDSRFGMPWKTPILRAEFENMGGRAGRYGAGHSFGRAMLIAATPFDQETLWRRYAEGQPEHIEPQLGKNPLESPVLHIIASRYARTEAELEQFLSKTLSGQWIWQKLLTLDEVILQIRTAVNRLADAGAISLNGDGRMQVTPFGQATATKGISLDTAQRLAQWISESETRAWSDLALIFAAASTPDGQLPYVTLTAREYEHAEYPRQLRSSLEYEPLANEASCNPIRYSSAAPLFEEVRSMKIALVLKDWLEHAALCEIEERFHTSAGQILCAADQISWLIDAAVAIATAFGSRAEFIDRMRCLAECVQRGVQEELLPLARLRRPELTRNTILNLAAHELAMPQAITAATTEYLERWMSRHDAHTLHKWASAQIKDTAGQHESSVLSSKPALVINDRHPGSILLDGVPIRLQEKQYRLIRVLAEHAGDCVPYDSIYQAVWGDTVVESNQMHFQKRKLLDHISCACPPRAGLISTVPKRGFVLNLSPENILMDTALVSTAA